MVFLIFIIHPPVSFGSVNDLRRLGYSLIPAPQKIEITGKKVLFDSNWVIETKLDAGTMAVRRLQSGAMEFYDIKFMGTGRSKIILEIIPGNGINRDLSPEIAKQAYRLVISSGLVRITANDGAGLFYGVQSFLQLLHPEQNGNYSLPEGTITDWPDLQLRFIHWDTKHHQNRIETLKRHLDWAAYFKVNAVAFEMEDKYEYPSHPVIGAPGAYTKAECQ